jgi:Arc/MetJ-type ribon-helix-helix transcriptional regulator
MISKQRLSASVDADLIEAAEAAVARGRFESVSAWVNDALRFKLEQDRRLDALGEFVARYEAEHGEITADEIRGAARRASARAIVARPTRKAGRKRGSLVAGRRK